MAEGALLNLSSCSQGDKILGGTERRCCSLPPHLQRLFCSAVLTHAASFLANPTQPTKKGDHRLHFRVTVALRESLNLKVLAAGTSLSLR